MESPPNSPPDLYAYEEFDPELDEPLQVPHLSSTNQYFSGTKNALPFMRSDSFIYVFPDSCKDKFGTVFIESGNGFKFSEYNFGACFDNFEPLVLEMTLDFHRLFESMLDYKWPQFDFELIVNIYSDRGVAIYELPNVDYWPPILAWFAFQCLCNGINFFEHVRKLGEQSTEYNTIFA